MKIIDVYKNAVKRLGEAGIENPAFDAKILFEHVFSLTYSDIIINPDIGFDEAKVSELDKLIGERLRGRPLQYIIGKWDFYESEFEVGQGVLIPRPETEELVDEVVKFAKALNNPLIFDLCSGSGCIGISIAKKIPTSTVYCIEKSEQAFKYLEKNANGLSNVVTILADINDDFDLPQADIIVSNPPYIKSNELSSLQKEVRFEPKMALDGGIDGLDFYRIINDKWHTRLKKNGRLFLEIGNDQGESIKDALISFTNVTVKKDIYSNDRIVIAEND